MLEPSVLTGLVDGLSARLANPLPADGQDKARAVALLEDAVLIVADATGWDIAKFADWPPVARLVVLAAAKRAFSNPEGLRYEQIGAYAYTRDVESSSGSVWLSKKEMDYLSRLSGRYSVSTVAVERGQAPGMFRGRRRGY